MICRRTPTNMNDAIRDLMISTGVHRYVTEDCQHRMEVLARAVAEACVDICEEGKHTQTTAQGAAEAIRLRFELSTKESK
jgi:hypothetical protein